MATPQYLLKGAVYALEQCGLLLRDAALLYRNGSYASAVALAAFAREELGRWKILRALREEVIGGKEFTLKDIEARCGDHVQKQSAGMVSITMRADRDTGLGRLLSLRHTLSPGSEEWKAVDKRIKKLDRQLKKRGPGDRHKQRMSALYVDAVSLERWNRPAKEISQSSAHDFLEDAGNDYSLQFDRYTNLEILKATDPELSSALAQWSTRPILPVLEGLNISPASQGTQAAIRPTVCKSVRNVFARLFGC